MIKDLIDLEKENQPLCLSAMSKNDLLILSTIIQDSIVDSKNIKWLPKSRRFAMLINRFRWEDENFVRFDGGPFERVQSTLVFEGVLTAQSKGIEQKHMNQYWILMIEVSQNENNQSQFIKVKFADSGTISLQVEYIEAFLKDVSRPFYSSLTRLPNHGI